MKTNLMTSLMFTATKPKTFPRGTRAFILSPDKSEAFIIRPDARRHSYRIDYTTGFGIYEAQEGIDGYFASPEDAAKCLELYLENGRKPTAPSVALIGRAISAIASMLLEGKVAMISGGSPVAVMATV